MEFRVLPQVVHGRTCFCVHTCAIRKRIFLSTRSLANAGWWIPEATAAVTKFFLAGYPSPVLRAGVGGGLIVVCADTSCRRPLERTPINMVPGVAFGLGFGFSGLPSPAHACQMGQKRATAINICNCTYLVQHMHTCTHMLPVRRIRFILRVHNGMAVSAVLVRTTSRNTTNTASTRSIMSLST